MRTFAYVGDCAKGEVVFRVPNKDDTSTEIVMPKGEPVEVPDLLARKLQSNGHFVEHKGKQAPSSQVDGEGESRDECGAATATPSPPITGSIEARDQKSSTSAGRRALIAERLRATPAISNRQIARSLGVSHPTVAHVRMKLEAAGELERLTSCIGSDGKERPRKRGAPKSASLPDTRVRGGV
ncbi:MAG: winged helix-turn-helix domain-containing protein [Steroidobacteraceae bacterium]